ncbi:DNA-methyltransferase [Dysosmobacter welbionis]|uniref:DNA-methyltransferase n=1 Tax=Dysosmobacter welbionis TaxID=2093857 RepID=UPI003AF65847
MSRVETGTVDLVLCDLPYGSTNCSWDTVIPFEPLWEQYRRILKPRGALVLFAAQPFATDLINSARKLFRYDLIWEKNAPVGFANCHRQPLRSHELILVFYRRQPTYHPQGLVRLDTPIMRRGKRSGSVYKDLGKTSVQEYTNYPRSILRFPNRAEKRYHPTQKPVALLEYLVRTYTDPGELVLDNCMGSGSTAVACLNAGRRFVGFELEAKYYEAACRRVADRAKQLTAE